MSELIDRIIDVEKISGEVLETMQLLDKLKGEISNFSTSVKNTLGYVRKSKGTDDLVKGVKSLNDNVVSGTKTMKIWEKEVENLRVKTEKLTGAEKLANIEIAKARLELASAQKEIKATAIAQIEAESTTKDLEGSYNKLQKELKQSIADFKALSGAEANSAKGKDLLNKIHSTNDSLKKMDYSMGNYQRNVGNYGSALQGLMPQIGGLGCVLLDFAKNASVNSEKIESLDVPLQGASLSFKGLATQIWGATKQMLAFLATPVGAILAIAVAVGSAVKAVFDYNSSILENQKLIENLFNKTGKLADNIRTSISALAETFGVEFKSLANAVDNLMDTGVAKDELQALEMIKNGLVKAPDKNEFINSLENTALIAKQVGLDLEDVISAKESIEKRGINSEAVFGSLQKATKNLAIGSDSLRNSLKDAFGSAFSSEILDGIKNGEITTAQALEKIDEKSKKVSLNNTERANLQTDLFGKQALAAGGLNEILGVISDTTKKSEEPLTVLQQKTKDLADANSELSKEKDDALKSDAVILFQKNIELLWINIQKGFFSVIKVFGDLFKWIDKTTGYSEVLGETWNELKNYFNSVKTYIDAVVNSFKNLTGGLGGGNSKVSEFIKNLFKMMNPLTSIKLLLKLMSAGLQGFADFVNNATIKILTFAGTIKTTFTQIANAVKSFDLKHPIESLKAFTKIDIASNFKKTEQAVKSQIDNNKKLKKSKEEVVATDEKVIKTNEDLTKSNEKVGKSESDKADAILQAQRRLKDSELSLMADSYEKDLALSQENFKRKIEDLEKNGELTKELRKNLETAQQTEEQKIKSDWDAKKLNDEIKNDELILANKQKAGEDTLQLEKDLLKKRMDAEIKAGGNVTEIQKKYQLLSIDLENENTEKKIKAYEDFIKKEVEILTRGEKEKELELKKQFKDGKLTRKEYEEELLKIQSDSAKQANEKTIELLQKQLEISGLDADKKTEISNKIRDLQIANENAVLDATIKANEEKVNSDKTTLEKRKEVAEKLVDATMELFNSIADFEKQRYETKIAEYEKEQELSDATFEKQQENIDNAIMSDENRAQKQKELTEEKAKRDTEIANKIKAEKIKQARWEKAQGIISTIISTAKGVMGASPIIPLMALIGAMGAVQIATIASQPINAYEKGGITGNEVALWGEKRPEVAVTPSGETFLAENPTISKFDAGTRIFKSVSDYENKISLQKSDGFSFDYDKMAGKIPKQSIVLDNNGMWNLISGENRRQILINRKLKL